MKSLSTRIDSLVSGKRTLIMLILYLIYQTVMLTYAADIFYQYTDQIPLDGQFNFTVEESTNYIDSLTVHGRNVYLLFLIVDMLFLITYTFAFTFILIYIFDKGKLKGSWIYRFRLLPILGGFLDFLENLSIISMIKAFPGELPLLSSVANIIIMIKLIFGPIYLLLMIIGGIFVIKNRLIDNKRERI